MSIDTPKYEAHPYEPRFEPTDLNVPEAVGVIRFTNARNAAKLLLWTAGFTLAGVTAGQVIDQPADDAYHDALAEATADHKEYLANAEDQVADAEAGVQNVDDFFDGAPECLFLIRRYGPYGEEATTRADQLAKVLESRENTGICSTQDSGPTDVLDWIDYVDYWDSDLAEAQDDLIDEQNTAPEDYIDDAKKDAARDDLATVGLGMFGVSIGLVTFPISSEDSIARARIKRRLKDHLDPVIYLTERSPVATHRKLKEDAAWALRSYKKAQPEQDRLFAPNRAERRAHAKQKS